MESGPQPPQPRAFVGPRVPVSRDTIRSIDFPSPTHPPSSPASPLPSDTPAVSRIEDSSQHTCGASDSSPTPPSLARTVHSSRIYRSLCPLCAYLRDSLPDYLPFVPGRETKENGGEASTPAICCVGFSLRVTCPINVLVFSSLPSLPPPSFSLTPSPSVVSVPSVRRGLTIPFVTAGSLVGAPILKINFVCRLWSL